MTDKTSIIPMGGGLNLVDSPIRAKPGQLLFSQNYEVGVDGSYRRINGFERTDGRPSPTAASYWILNYDAGVAAVLDGDIVVGAASGASGEALIDNIINSGSFGGSDAAGSLVLTNVVGVFLDDEDLEVSTVKKSEADGIALQRAASTRALDSTYLSNAAETARVLIGKVPGEGRILGTYSFNDIKYAFRNNVGSTEAVMFESSAAGWVAVVLNRYIDFTSGGPEFFVGDVIEGDTSGATATVVAINKISGTFGVGDLVGRLTLSGIAGGPFQNGEGLEVSASNVATADGADAVPVLAIDGKYRFITSNFTGHSGTRKMYGCDGVNLGFQYDGTNFVQIRTGITTDTPKFVAAFQKHLFFGFIGGNFQNSALGDPLAFTVILGSAQMAIGDDLTNMIILTDTALGIFSRNSTHILYGTSVADFVSANVQKHAERTGAFADTVQSIAGTIFFDDRGITSLSSTERFGNFLNATISQKIQPLIELQRANTLSSTILRDKNQYRVFFEDGTAFAITFTEEDKVSGITVLDFGKAVRTISSVENSAGLDEILFGSDDGFVYEMNKGRSFDGEKIVAYLRPVYVSMNTPQQKKRFRSFIFDIEAEETTSLVVVPDFDFSTSDIPGAIQQQIDLFGGGGSWNEVNWNEFIWNAQTITEGRLWIEGTGVNIGMLIYSTTATELPHIIHGVTILWSPRGLKKH